MLQTPFFSCVPVFYVLYFSSVVVVTFGGGDTTNHVRNSSVSHFVYKKSSLALLSGTLRTYQKAACDDAWLNLQCPEGTTISIQFAQYGRTAATPALCGETDILHPFVSATYNHHNLTCYSSKAYQTIVSRCQKKRDCLLHVTPQSLGGDPCPSLKKFIEVAFKCRPSHFLSEIGCEDDLVHLSCPANSRLAIYSANFGRTEYESRQCPQPHGVQEETCLAPFATETVMNLCHGKRECRVISQASTFGRPCRPQSRMYLKVIHTCVPRKVLKKKYRGEVGGDEERDDGDNDEGVGGDNEGEEQPPSNNVLQKGADDPTLLKSSAVAVSEVDLKTVEYRNVTGEEGKIITLISQGVNAYAFIERHSPTFYLLIAISMLSVLLLLLVLLLVRLIYTSRKDKMKKDPEKKSPHRESSDEIDELSLVMDPLDYMTSVPKTTFHDTLTRKNNDKVVRYSNSRNSLFPEDDDVTRPPKSWKEDDDNVGFFFG